VVDASLVTGATTSGCVRATVVDGMQYGFRVAVLREGVGDRVAPGTPAGPVRHGEHVLDVVVFGDALEYFASVREHSCVAGRLKRTRGGAA
jgi:maleamate amidohydrolase